MGLNNYSKTIPNIIYWIENEKTILDLHSIENGKIIKTETGFRVEPNEIYNTIDELISIHFGDFNKEKFIKFYYRYIKTWVNMTGHKDKEYPININDILKLSLLDKRKYNIDKIVEGHLNNINNDLNIIIENNKNTEEDFNFYIDMVLSNFPDKVEEYKNGKLGILNLFFGEIMKSLPNKNIDKSKLRNNIELKLI